jgi:hypothetical protein
MRFDKKVIYLRYMPPTAKIYSDFYMGEVEEEALLKVEYWDVTLLFLMIIMEWRILRIWQCYKIQNL